MEEPQPKRVRLNPPELSVLEGSHDLASLVSSLGDEVTTVQCAPAWSSSNLLAAAHTHPPAVVLTHFSPAFSPSKPHRKPTVTLPLQSSNLLDPPKTITRLSFAPNASHLLVVAQDELTLFRMEGGGTIDSWTQVWREKLGALGVGKNQSAGAVLQDAGASGRVIELRWLGEGRRWYPHPSAPASAKPLYCAPARSPPLSSTALLLVLSTNEILFLSFPPGFPAQPPLALVLPLAIPTQFPQLASPLLSTTGNPVDDIISNLVNGVVTGVVDVAGPGSSIGETSAAGGQKAMKEELRAAETAETKSHDRSEGATRRIKKAAIGTRRCPKKAQPCVTFLVASTSVKNSLSPPMTAKATAPPLAGAEALLAPIATVTAVSSAPESPSDFGMPDFSAFDEAFGDPTPVPPAQPHIETDLVSMMGDGEFEGNASSDGVEGDGGAVELVEVVIDLRGADGPRLSMRPLTPLHLSDPTTDEQLPASARGALTHLEWLEDVAYADEGYVIEGDEPPVDDDMRLLAITHSYAPTDGSLLTTWSLKEEPYELSDAFSSLDVKLKDAGTGDSEWISKFVASRTTDGVITFLSSERVPAYGSFYVGEVEGEKTLVRVLSSNTLEPLAEFGDVQLPARSLYTSACVSPNCGLICAANPGRASVLQPVVAALSIGSDPTATVEALAIRLALAIAQQGDASDSIGRIIGFKDDAQSLAVAGRTASILESMLPPPKTLENSPLQLELFGALASVYRPSTALSIRGSIAYDVTLLAACTRAFRVCRTRDRESTPATYRCESDSVWPLIGYAKWYADFSRDLVKECTQSKLLAEDTQPHPRLLFLLLPLTRAHLLRIVEVIAGLAGFLNLFPPQTNVMIDVSKSLLDDIIQWNGLVLKEWEIALRKIGELEGVRGDQPGMHEMLTTLAIPSALNATSQSVLDILSSPSLLLATPPSPPPTPQTLPEMDIVRKARITPQSLVRACTNCGSKSELVTEDSGGRWATAAMGWEARCSCGGVWVTKRL